MNLTVTIVLKQMTCNLFNICGTLQPVPFAHQVTIHHYHKRDPRTPEKFQSGVDQISAQPKLSGLHKITGLQKRNDSLAHNYNEEVGRLVCRQEERQCFVYDIPRLIFKTKDWEGRQQIAVMTAGFGNRQSDLMQKFYQGASCLVQKKDTTSSSEK